jgi:hypothetical protein
MRAPRRRWFDLLRTLVDPRAWIHLVRILHFYSYSHVRERGRMSLAPDTELAPNLSIRHGDRIRAARGREPVGCGNSAAAVQLAIGLTAPSSPRRAPS